MESFQYDFETGDIAQSMKQAAERSAVRAQIAQNQRDPNKLTDYVFYLRNPAMRGQRITANQMALPKEWLDILHSVVEPLLKPAVSSAGNITASTGGARDTDVTAALSIGRKPVPNMPGVTIRQLLEKWRPQIAPEIPLPLLLAFLHYESGGNFNDATHGSPGNHPPYTQPAFYELGLFQTPAGLHGTCTTGEFGSCQNPPPGREVAGDPSTWARLCKTIGANPSEWTIPTTQVRVGILDLKTSADAIRAAYPGLFPTPGSDWYLRMAVLLPFARGGGFARAFLRAFRTDLATLPETRRWDFLQGKRAGSWLFDPANVDKKMSLAARLGAFLPRNAPA